MTDARAGRTWVYWLNFLVFQWLFVRLARVIDTRRNRQVGWTWLVGVLPLTGWWGRFAYVCDFCRKRS